MTRSIATRLALPSLLLFGSIGCDYTGDWLFAGTVENLDGIQHLYAEDGGDFLVPIPNGSTADEIRDLTIYGEIGPTGDARDGGSTFNFLGTGGPVCVFVDPETVFWSWSIAPNPNTEQRVWNYPDNVFDDGDIELFVGLSAYYTGSPGVEIGDFEVSYTDSLGNPVPIELSECTNIGRQGQTNAHAGRGFPELCGLAFTDPGVSYTGLLQTFNTPLDDDRMGYGLIVYEGTCENLIFTMTGIGAQQQGDSPQAQECLITGESIIPRPLKEGEIPYCTGQGCKDQWAGSVEFETEYCLGGAADMRAFCRSEAKDIFEAGLDCERETIENLDARCFCGDPNDVPVPGAL